MLVTGLSTFNDDVEFIGNAAGITSAFWDKSANELKFYDGSKHHLVITKIYKSIIVVNHSFIDDIGTGNFLDQII
ncbi:hypothetical protein CM15mP5_1090 [bacterium]|nr:MAG: hypothetical protein CM15mP5_1090 [bacterium]